MDIRNSDRFDRKPSCVLLDLDNTLYEYAPCHDQGMEAAAAVASEQFSLNRVDFFACVDHARTEIKKRLGRTAASHSRLLYLQRAIEIAGLSTQALAALQLEQAYWRAFLSTASLFDEVVEFLDDLRIAGVPLVIVTDLTTQIQLRKILHLGLHRFVDWVVTSEESGADKPASINFELALAKLGGVEGPVWMVGEDPVSDIEGARLAIGASTLQKRHAGVEIFSEGPRSADAVFEHFGQARRILAQAMS